MERVARLVFALLVATASAGCAAEEGALAEPGVTADELRSRPDRVIQAAYTAGQIGERADGYLGVRLAPASASDLRARVSDINIRRRALYTELATRHGVTVSTIARATACELFASRIVEGEWYRDPTETWRRYTADAPVVMPSDCAAR